MSEVLKQQVNRTKLKFIVDTCAYSHDIIEGLAKVGENSVAREIFQSWIFIAPLQVGIETKNKIFVDILRASLGNRGKKDKLHLLYQKDPSKFAFIDTKITSEYRCEFCSYLMKNNILTSLDDVGKAAEVIDSAKQIMSSCFPKIKYTDNIIESKYRGFVSKLNKFLKEDATTQQKISFFKDFNEFEKSFLQAAYSNKEIYASFKNSSKKNGYNYGDHAIIDILESDEYQSKNLGNVTIVVTEDTDLIMRVRNIRKDFGNSIIALDSSGIIDVLHYFLKNNKDYGFLKNKLPDDNNQKWTSRAIESIERGYFGDISGVGL
jgi:hypothetical protein